MPRRSSSTVPKLLQGETEALLLIHTYPTITRGELAVRLGLSPAALSIIVNALLTRDLLVETPDPETKLGRKRLTLCVRPGLAYVAGMDLGTYWLRGVITDIAGNVRASADEPSHMEEGQDAFIKHGFNFARRLIQKAKIAPDHIRGIGLSSSSVIEAGEGIVLSYPRPGHFDPWRGVPLRDLASTAFGVPAHLENSVRSAAVMERYFGAGRTFRDFVYVDVGMGVGSAIFMNGELYCGGNGAAGEFGHMTVAPDGPLCCCGSNGCLEAMASCATVIASVRHAITRGVSSSVYDLAGGNLSEISIEHIAQAAEAHDSLCFRALSQATSHIGAAAANVINFLNPEAIIFGGAFFRASPETLLAQVGTAIRYHALERSFRGVKLMVSDLNGLAAARGAARRIAAQLLPTIYSEHIPRS